MNLMTKVFVLAVIAVAIIAICSYVIGNTNNHILSRQKAEANVTYYIKTAYPGSNVTITSISNMSPGIWNIVASVVKNSTKPCPSYSVLTFDQYPRYALVFGVQNNYTTYVNVSGYGKVCQIHGTASSSSAAIAWSYINLNQSKAFVNRYGYQNVNVYANYLASLAIDGHNFTSVYLINYTSPLANHTLSLMINLSQYSSNQSVQHVFVYSFNTST